MPDYLMNFGIYPKAPVEIRDDGVNYPSIDVFVPMPWHDLANEYEGVLVEIRKDGVVFNLSEKSVAGIRAAWSQPLRITDKISFVVTLTRIVEPPKPIEKIAYLIGLESLGCLPDHQEPAFSWADALEAARSMFDNERDGFGWTWSVNNKLTSREVISAAPWGCTFAEQNGNGLYRVVITAVEEEIAKEWEDD